MISSSAKFTICSYPYNYLIIEDCFETNAAYGLSSVFNDLIRSGRSVGKIGEVGDLVYDAINFTPTTDHVRNTPIANIASGELKALIADVRVRDLPTFVSCLLGVGVDAAKFVHFVVSLSPKLLAQPTCSFCCRKTAIRIGSLGSLDGRFRGEVRYRDCNVAESEFEMQLERHRTARAVPL